jgi:AcrR family transcriptional regulator
MRVEEKKQLKLDRIIESASELFASSEYHEVCMDDIAVHAKVGKGTLYNLFTSKEDLYFSIIRHRLGELISILERTYDSRNDTLKNLRSLILHLHKFMSKHPDFYLLWKKEETLSGGAPRQPELSDLHGRVIELIVNVLKRGETEGVLLPASDHGLVAHVLLGMIDGLRKSRERVFEKERDIDGLFAILLRGIAAEGVELAVTYDEYRHVSGKGGA